MEREDAPEKERVKDGKPEKKEVKQNERKPEKEKIKRSMTIRKKRIRMLHYLYLSQ